MQTTKKSILPILLILTIVTASTLILGIPTVKAAATLEVPSPSYPTIQSALNTAKDGDTIKIAAGTYNENVNYDGYAQAIANGSSQPKTGIILQGSTGTIINGAVNLLFLKQFKIAGLTVTGDLTLGNSGAYGYVSSSVVSGVQVDSILTIGGSGNTVIDCQAKLLILKGANTKTEFPAVSTVVENNQLRGITIQAGSHSNTLKGNTISHGQTGITEEPSKTYYPTGNNQIVNNTITNNDVAVSLYSSTGDNGAQSHSADKFVQNIIRDNTVGLMLSASSQYVVGNNIYHNDFVGNGVQIKINNPVVNTWDDGAAKGNYYSDYTGKDANGDGVGDVPYKIDAQNQDNYPLMKPWSSPASVTATLAPSQSVSQTSNPVASGTSNKSSLPVASESTPLYAVTGLLAVSVLALFLLKRKAAPI
jgi:nitrous oxidase accessory protein NosD